MYNNMLSFFSPCGNLMAFVTHAFGSDCASSEFLPLKKREINQNVTLEVERYMRNGYYDVSIMLIIPTIKSALDIVPTFSIC